MGFHVDIGARTKPIFKGVSANTIKGDFCGMELQENEKGVNKAIISTTANVVLVGTEDWPRQTSD